MTNEWVTVPREPTIDMLAEGERAMNRLGWDRFTSAVWKRMLDAAPAAPRPAEPVGDGPVTMADAFSCGHAEGINDCLRNGLDWAHEYMGGTPGRRAKSGDERKE